MKIPKIISNDPYLNPYKEIIIRRLEKTAQKEMELTSQTKTLANFALGHLYFGLHKNHDRWVFRECAPNATAIYLTGQFSNWKANPSFALTRIDSGAWEIHLPLETLKHLDLYRLLIQWHDGEGDRIPAWATRVVQDSNTLIFNAQVWDPETPYCWKNNNRKRNHPFPLIYEAHIGMATPEERVGTYTEFRLNILPRIIKAGYNTIQLMAIQEHPYYGSFGYHVTNFFAASSRFGTPEELKALIDEAHGAGLNVIMDIVHSHAAKNEVEGLSNFDGTRYQYFHDGDRGNHIFWDSRCFDYNKTEVIHFLLSNCQFWLKEYNFDGFRFDGVTSMLYLDHGMSRSFSDYRYYFDGHQDEEAISYLILANKLIHEIAPEAITIAEEVSGMPGIASELESGGFGFDYRLAMGIPDYWIKAVKEKRDEDWNIGELYYELNKHRDDEKTISYAESHDQALVGDKTIIFWLIDKEMYFNMHINHKNLMVDPGMALHKMIRLITVATANSGYLNFMGNEFGHPEWINFPRQGNNWSYKYARRQWNLVDDPNLRYHFLANFDRDMIALIKKENYLLNHVLHLYTEDFANQILVFERTGLIFIFNFHPINSVADYRIKLKPGEYQILLNSDSSNYGGFERVDSNLIYRTTMLNEVLPGQQYLQIYLPNRTALVLKEADKTG